MQNLTQKLAATILSQMIKYRIVINVLTVIIIEHQYNIFMKAILSLILLIAVASAFQIRHENEEVQAERLGYPFSTCGQTGISFTSLTLDQTPALNINLTGTVVGKAKKDLALDHAVITISMNLVPIITIQEDYNVTYKNGETTNFTFTYEIPQYQTRGGYLVVIRFIDNHDEGCIGFSYTL